MKSLIVTISLIAVAATAATLFVGSRTFEGLVVEKPYETGLAWDQIQRNNAHAGWKIDLRENEFRIGANNVSLIVTDKNGGKIREAVVRITVSRPSTGQYDHEYSAVMSAKGSYDSKIELPLFGAWDLIVKATRGTDTVSYQKRIYAGKS